MKLRDRIAGAFLLLVLVAAGLAVYLLALVEQLDSDHHVLAGTTLTAAAESVEVRRLVIRHGALSKKHSVLADPDYATRVETLREDVEEGLERLSALSLSPPEAEALAAFETAWRPYAASALKRLPEALLDEKLERLDELSKQLYSASKKVMELRREASARRTRRARAAAWVAALAGLGAALGLSIVITRSVVGPLRRLAHGTRELAEGDFGHRVEPGGGPELEALARDFNAMAERLGELDRLKKEFLSTVSHDLKAPLASAQETLRLLLDEVPGPLTERQRRHLRLNLETSQRLGRMIEDLLDLARLEAGAAELELGEVDLRDVAAQAAESLEGLAHGKGLEVDQRQPARAVTVRGDEDRLMQLAGNLLANAVRFSPEGGKLGVEVDEQSGTATLAVWDEGPGVPDELKERVFERFHRGQGAGGTGLGLTIARRLAEAHGGRLWVEDREGGGSRFVLLLESPR